MTTSKQYDFTLFVSHVTITSLSGEGCMRELSINEISAVGAGVNHLAGVIVGLSGLTGHFAGMVYGMEEGYNQAGIVGAIIGTLYFSMWGLVLGILGGEVLALPIYLIGSCHEQKA